MNDVHDDIICDLLEEVELELGGNAATRDALTRIESRIRFRWAGQRTYFRVKDSDKRAAAIRAEYNGMNRLELQAKYGISRAHFYKIIKGG